MTAGASTKSAPGWPSQLGTARLALTPLADADADAVHALWSTPAVGDALWRGHRLSPEQSREMTSRSAWLHRHQGLGLWAAREHGQGALAGVGGFWFLHDERLPELLYAVAPGRWGRGLGSEMVHALVAYAWSVLRLTEIRAFTERDNRGSVRLLRRLGFAPEGRGGALQAYRLAPAIVDDSWGA